MKPLRTVLLILSMALFCSAVPAHSENFSRSGQIKAGSWLRDVKVPYKWEGNAFSADAQIYFPKGYGKGPMRSLVVLHGYNQNMRVWELNTGIGGQADRYGFVLVCPNMGKTLYETSFYPETTVRWGGMPGGKFIAEALIDFMRDSFNLCESRSTTGIMGNSTGARGALILSARYPDRFGACAGLSGDYDPSIMTTDRLLTSIYGEYGKFTDRWEKEASVIHIADKLGNTPVFLTHGNKDSVVSREQSIILAIRLKQLQKKGGVFDLTFREKRYKMHDWSFWGSMVPEIMAFFDEKLPK